MKDLGELAEQGYFLERAILEHKNKIKELQEKLDGIEIQVSTIMKDQNLTSFKHKMGTVVLTTRFTVKQPATPDEKERFFNYLKEKDIFDRMISVNSQTLNAWFKAEMEDAKIRGDFDFAVPGLLPPTASEYVSFRKG